MAGRRRASRRESRSGRRAGRSPRGPRACLRQARWWSVFQTNLRSASGFVNASTRNCPWRGRGRAPGNHRQPRIGEHRSDQRDQIEKRLTGGRAPATEYDRHGQATRHCSSQAVKETQAAEVIRATSAIARCCQRPDSLMPQEKQREERCAGAGHATAQRASGRRESMHSRPS